MLHSFGGAPANPSSSLTVGSDGNLYGTTSGGGDGGGYGTVFRMDLSGNLTTLHSFRYSDGAFPFASLIQAADGNFYGVTFRGDPLLVAAAACLEIAISDR